MSTGSSASPDLPAGTTITLTREKNWWVATDEETDVTSQGKTRQEALDNLDEALQVHHGEGDPPSDEELRSIGVRPERNKSDPIEDSEIFE